MNFGMRCHDICKKSDMDTVFDAVKANNISQIQLAMGKSIAGYNFGPGHYSPGMAHLVGDGLAARGIHVAILGCYINPTNPDEAARKKAVAQFIEHLKYAKIIGADMVGTETGRASSDFSVVPETYTEENYQLLLKSMREIVSAAEKIGTVVGIEAVHDHTLNTPKKMKRFLDDIDSPMVEAILDPVNLISAEDFPRQEEVIEEALALYGDRITALHIKDMILDEGRPKFEHVGDGVFNYEPVLRWVKYEKPEIAVLLEISNPGRFHSDTAYLQKIYDRL